MFVLFDVAWFVVMGAFLAVAYLVMRRRIRHH